MTPPRKPPPPSHVRIYRIGAAGDGVGTLAHGSPVYLPLTLPGELVIARPLRAHGDGWFAEAETIEVPSPARVPPPCRHFGACGGCVLQHWDDAAYRAWKTGLLDTALRAAGFAPPDPIELIPGLTGERRRLDFAVRRAGGRIILGLHGSRSAEVIDLTDCKVLHPPAGSADTIARVADGLCAIRRQGLVVINLLTPAPTCCCAPTRPRRWRIASH